MHVKLPEAKSLPIWEIRAYLDNDNTRNGQPFISPIFFYDASKVVEYFIELKTSHNGLFKVKNQAKIKIFPPL